MNKIKPKQVNGAWLATVDYNGPVNFWATTEQEALKAATEFRDCLCRT